MNAMRFTVIKRIISFIHDIKTSTALGGRLACVMGMPRLREHRCVMYRGAKRRYPHHQRVTIILY